MSFIIYHLASITYHASCQPSSLILSPPALRPQASSLSSQPSALRPRPAAQPSSLIPPLSAFRFMPQASGFRPYDYDYDYDDGPHSSLLTSHFSLLTPHPLPVVATAAPHQIHHLSSPPTLHPSPLTCRRHGGTALDSPSILRLHSS